MSPGSERDGTEATEPPTARLRAFYARHPTGAVRTTLVRHGPLVAVRAAVYRAPADDRPAATALAAWERRVTPPYRRTDATLRAAESRAIDQALAYLGVAAVADDAAGRAPARPVRVGDDPYGAPPAPPAPPRRPPRATRPAPPALRERVADLDALIGAALHAGLRPARAAVWRRRLHAMTDDAPSTLDALDRVERRLRMWVARDEPF